MLFFETGGRTDRRIFRPYSTQRLAHMALTNLSKNVLKITGIVAFVALILVATLVLHVQDHIGDILDWIEDHKVAGSLTFVAIYALFTGGTPYDTNMSPEDLGASLLLYSPFHV